MSSIIPIYELLKDLSKNVNSNGMIIIWQQICTLVAESYWQQTCMENYNVGSFPKEDRKGLRTKESPAMPQTPTNHATLEIYRKAARMSHLYNTFSVSCTSQLTEHNMTLTA